MEPHKVERRLAAILHADVKGYSRLIGEDEVATLRVLAAYLEMMSTLVQRHGGRAVGSHGDSLLAEFPSVVEVVQCAVGMQHELKVRNNAYQRPSSVGASPCHVAESGAEVSDVVMSEQ
jgi:adenylate cyclase